MNPHPLPLTTLYVALGALLLLALALLVVRQRARLRGVFGEGDASAAALKRAIRVHANAVEFLPVSLLVLFFCEMAGLAPFALHVAGTALLLGRVAHAVGLSRAEATSTGRAAGAAVQFTFLLVLPAWLLGRYAGLC